MVQKKTAKGRTCREWKHGLLESHKSDNAEHKRSYTHFGRWLVSVVALLGCATLLPSINHPRMLGVTNVGQSRPPKYSSSNRHVLVHKRLGDKLVLLMNQVLSFVMSNGDRYKASLQLVELSLPSKS